jgi:hypothetical protein
MLPFSLVHSRLALLAAHLLLPAALLMHSGTPAAAQEAKQIKLTEKQIQGFIAAQKAMSAIAEKMENTTSDKPDPKIQAELEDVAKKNGFKDYAEYDDVAANISMVMAGIDPQTKEFTDAQTAIKKEIDEVNADKSITAEEKKQLLDELNESLKSAVTIQNRGNIDLVRKYYDKIDALIQ